MSQTKVLYIVEEPKLGGPQVQMARVAKAISGHADVKLLIPDGDNVLFCELCDQLNVPYEIIPLSGLTRQAGPLAKFLLRSPFEIAGLVRKIREEKPDVIHCWGGAWQFKAAFASKMTGVPLVWLLNDTGLPWYIRRIFQFFARYCGASFIFASRKTRDYYGSLLPAGTLQTVIQSLVDIEAFDPEVQYRGDEELINSWGDDFVVGVIANVSPVKGLETFVDVAGRAAAAKGRKCRFVIVGQTYKRQEGLREKLLERAGRNGANNLHFAGARKDVRPLLQRFDAYLCTSLSVSSPVSVWEALAMGKPVVSTRVGDVPVFVKEGENGFLTDVGDDKKLWAGIAALIADPAVCQTMGQAARQTAVSSFSANKIASETLEFYRTVLDRKTASAD